MHHHHSSCIEGLSDHANVRILLFAFRRSGASSAQSSWAQALSRLGRKHRRCPFSICAFCSNQNPLSCEPGAPNRTRLSSLDASACALPAFSVGCFCEIAHRARRPAAADRRTPGPQDSALGRRSPCARPGPGPGSLRLELTITSAAAGLSGESASGPVAGPARVNHRVVTLPARLSLSHTLPPAALVTRSSLACGGADSMIPVFCRRRGLRRNGKGAVTERAMSGCVGMAGRLP